jgi:D-glycero-beta-D-manno-heptose 1-phosphate adenylyltransferase
MREIETKIFSLEELVNKREEWRNETVVFTNGCFDLLHRGHVFYLAEARKLGDRLIIGVNSDESVSRLKGPNRPIQNENDRMYILAGLESVDAVVLFHDETPLKLISQISPQVLVKGGDYEIEKIVGYDFVVQHGGIVKTIPFVLGKSTTNIVKKMQ